jgi:hypothetical protein
MNFQDVGELHSRIHVLENQCIRLQTLGRTDFKEHINHRKTTFAYICGFSLYVVQFRYLGTSIPPRMSM